MPDTADLASRLRFVLVRTSHPGNIGSAARAIRTMGFARMGLVSPAHFPDREANALAAGADDVLEHAGVHGELVDALAGCSFALGLSARRRGITLPEIGPREAARQALAAARRGFRVEMYLNTKGPLFVAGVRDETKKHVLEVVHRDFDAQIADSDVTVHASAATVDDLVGHVRNGGIPLVLISHYLLSRTKTPHWVVMAAADDHFVYLHDPEIDVAQHKSVTDSMYVPVRHESFMKMSRYGQSNLRATVVVYAGDGDDSTGSRHMRQTGGPANGRRISPTTRKP